MRKLPLIVSKTIILSFSRQKNMQRKYMRVYSFLTSILTPNISNINLEQQSLEVIQVCSLDVLAAVVAMTVILHHSQHITSNMLQQPPHIIGYLSRAMIYDGFLVNMSGFVSLCQY